MHENGSYLAGMASDSELTSSTRDHRGAGRPHSSQSRAYHAHPAPRPAGASSSSRLSHYSEPSGPIALSQHQHHTNSNLCSQQQATQSSSQMQHKQTKQIYSSQTSQQQAQLATITHSRLNSLMGQSDQNQPQYQDYYQATSSGHLPRQTTVGTPPTCSTSASQISAPAPTHAHLPPLASGSRPATGGATPTSWRHLPTRPFKHSVSIDPQYYGHEQHLPRSNQLYQDEFQGDPRIMQLIEKQASQMSLRDQHHSPEKLQTTTASANLASRVAGGHAPRATNYNLNLKQHMQQAGQQTAPTLPDYHDWRAQMSDLSSPLDQYQYQSSFQSVHSMASSLTPSNFNFNQPQLGPEAAQLNPQMSLNQQHHANRQINKSHHHHSSASSINYVASQREPQQHQRIAAATVGAPSGVAVLSALRGQLQKQLSSGSGNGAGLANATTSQPGSLRNSNVDICQSVMSIQNQQPFEMGNMQLGQRAGSLSQLYQQHQNSVHSMQHQQHQSPQTSIFQMQQQQNYQHAMAMGLDRATIASNIYQQQSGSGMHNGYTTTTNPSGSSYHNHSNNNNNNQQQLESGATFQHSQSALYGSQSQIGPTAHLTSALGQQQTSSASSATCNVARMSGANRLARAASPSTAADSYSSPATVNNINNSNNSNTRSECGSSSGAAGVPKSASNSSSLTKKSNSTTQLSTTGTKKRLGFRKKQVTSFSVHRSEEVAPLAARHLVKQGSSMSEGDSSMSGDSSRGSLNVNSFKPSADELASMSFIEGLGKGQMISRQGLASPYLGDIQMSFCDRRGNLEIEVIRARNLQAKSAKMPYTYVKLYLVKNRKCLAKAKTNLTTKRCLNPLYQTLLTFHEDYKGSILQAIVWGNFGKIDKKNFMGIAQISIDDLDLSETVISWYKLFLPSSLQTAMPSKSLRSSLLSNSTESFTNPCATNPTQNNSLNTPTQQSAANNPIAMVANVAHVNNQNINNNIVNQQQQLQQTAAGAPLGPFATMTPPPTSATIAHQYETAETVGHTEP